MTIILRTVCGCEKEVQVRERDYPPYYKVAYRLTNSSHYVFHPDEQIDHTALTYGARTFRRLPMTGKYGYPVYLEVLETK